MSKIRLKTIIVPVVLLLESFFISMQVSGTPLQFPYPSTDSSVFRYVALVMSKGGMPYLDAFDHKGPLTYIINYLGMQIAYWRGIWILEWLSVFTTLSFCYLSMRTIASRKVSHLVLACVSCLYYADLFGGNMTEEWALPFISFAVYVLSKYLRDGSVRLAYVFGFGVSLGAVLMLRPNMVSIWLVAGVVVAWTNIHEKRVYALCRYILVTFCGVFVVIAPILIWLNSGGALPSFFDAYIDFNMKYIERLGDGNALKLISLRLNALLTFCSEPVTLAALLISLYSIYTKGRISCWEVLFLISLITVALAGSTFEHYGLVLIPPVCMCLAMVVPNLDNRLDIPSAVPLYILIVVLINTGAPTWISMIQHTSDQLANPVSHGFTGELSEAIQMVDGCTSETDTVVVCGACPQINLESGRLSSTRWFFQNVVCNVDEGNLNEFFSDIDSAPPNAIVLPSDFFAKERMLAYMETRGFTLVGSTSSAWATVWKRA